MGDEREDVGTARFMGGVGAILQTYTATKIYNADLMIITIITICKNIFSIGASS